MTTATEKKQGYVFLQYGDQPIEVLGDLVKDMREKGEHHPVMQAKRYELVALPKGLDYQKFAEEFIEFKAEEGVVYVAIMSLQNRTEYYMETGPTGKIKKNDYVVKGQRKWETLHVVYRDNQDPANDHPWEELHRANTKGDAMDFARDHANKTGETVWVELEKRLVGSSSRVADLTPEVKEIQKTREVPHNYYLFFGKGEVEA